VKELVAPKWGLTMDEAVLVRWLKRPGETVDEGEPVAEMETDKTQADIESQVAGRIVELLVEEGETVRPGQAIARIEEPS
jgi:pyruvate/2-oxoglutarate dehydrogenase complex dihydrolipoamide acyltransferase (E2) component